MTDASSAPHAVEAAHLDVALGHRARPVLHDVDVVVPAGTSLLVVGPSGSGKSTLVRALVGVVPHTLPGVVRGHLRVAGTDPRETTPAALAAHVGLVQQRPGDQLCLARVDDELRFALENRGTDPATVDARSTAALESAGAAHLRDRPTHALSGGEAQRVALAAALVADPGLVVLDEPTALLDPAAAHDVGTLVAGLARPTTPVGGSDQRDPAGRGRSVVLVEHRLDELGTLPAATLALDRGGRVLAHGPTDHVLREHAGALAALGCRLPLAVRLEHAGAPAPLGDPATDDWLVDRARGTPARPARPAHGPALLRARGLGVLRGAPGRRRRGARPVVRDVDLDVRAGELLAVVGPNGGGKSTLLRGLAGVERTTGVVTTDAGSVALVLQDPEHQLLARTVREEVAWSARRARRPDVEARTARALERFGLAHVADESPYRLSGGEQRRLSLAAATVLDPPVLLADEPTSGLDRTQAAAVARALRDRADAGGAVVVVTHDLALAAAVADRLAVVVDGRLAAVAPAPHVLADDALRARAGLRLPPVLAWWSRVGRARGVDPGALVRALDAATDAATVPAALAGSPS